MIYEKYNPEQSTLRESLEQYNNYMILFLVDN